jgi:Dockerin type I domain
MRNMDYALFGGIILVGLGFAMDAQACSTDGWLGGVSGFPANAVAGSPPAVSRYSELCALAVTGQAHVQDDNPSDARYRARFYVLDGLTGAAAIDVFEAYSDEAATNPLFKVSFNGSQFTFDATDAGGTSTTFASVNGWNLVEFDWDSDTGDFDFWVNADATTDPTSGSVNSGTGTVEAVRLGAPNGFAPQTGKLTFDAFESHRTTPVGPLLVGDSNGNGSVTIADVVSVLNELAGTLQVGQPDCNENGSVTVADAVCLINSL